MTDRDLPQIIDAETLPAAPEPAHGDLLLSVSGFAHGMSVARELAASQMIPPAFRNKPTDILLALNIARRMGEDPFVILQSIHFVSGKPGWNATFLIARAATSGIFAGPLEFDTTGEGVTLAVTCTGTLRQGGKRVSRTVSMAMARAEGWVKNAKYSSLPEQMLSYRSAVFLLRLYAPSILLGLRSTDELQDIEASNGRVVDRITVEPEPTPTRTSRRQALPIPAEPTAEHVELVQEMVQGRQTVEVAEAPVVVEPTPAEDPDAARKALHHESWKANGYAAQRAFFAKVKDLDLSRTVVSDFAETRGTKQRPSAMDAVRRAKFLAWLGTPEGRAAYDDFVLERAEQAARDVEPDAVVVETAEVTQ